MSNNHEADEKSDFALNATFWLNGQALGFPVQFDLVLKHLRQDMRDDWYFDCLQYDDIFKDPTEAGSIPTKVRNPPQDLTTFGGLRHGLRVVV